MKWFLGAVALVAATVVPGIVVNSSPLSTANAAGSQDWQREPLPIPPGSLPGDSLQDALRHGTAVAAVFAAVAGGAVAFWEGPRGTAERVAEGTVAAAGTLVLIDAFVTGAAMLPRAAASTCSLLTCGF